MKLFVSLILALILTPAASLFAQTATLRGQVADDSGALVPGAKVTLTGPQGVVKVATSDDKGSYVFAGLASGDYQAIASAPDLTMLQPVSVSLNPGVQTLNLQLKLVGTAEHVTVQENSGPAVSTDSSSNASAVVLRGDDLQALSDDPDDLAADLQALAGLRRRQHPRETLHLAPAGIVHVDLHFVAGKIRDRTK